MLRLGLGGASGGYVCRQQCGVVEGVLSAAVFVVVSDFMCWSPISLGFDASLHLCLAYIQPRGILKALLTACRLWYSLGFGCAEPFQGGEVAAC